MNYTVRTNALDLFIKQPLIPYQIYPVVLFCLLLSGGDCCVCDAFRGIKLGVQLSLSLSGAET